MCTLQYSPPSDLRERYRFNFLTFLPNRVVFVIVGVDGVAAAAVVGIAGSAGGVVVVTDVAGSK